MSKSEEYRSKAVLHRRRASELKSLRDGGKERKIADAYEQLAATEDWLDGVVEPAPRAPRTAQGVIGKNDEFIASLFADAEIRWPRP